MDEKGIDISKKMGINCFLKMYFFGLRFVK